jgi:hypothetical protein
LETQFGLKPGKRGEMIVITGGRNVGKSAFLQKFLDGIKAQKTEGENNMLIKVTEDNIKDVLNVGDTVIVDGQKTKVEYCYWEHIDYDIGFDVEDIIHKKYDDFRCFTISRLEVEFGHVSIYKSVENNTDCPVKFETGMVVVEQKDDGKIFTGIVFKSEHEEDEDVVKYIDGDDGFNFLHHIENKNLQRKTSWVTRTVIKVYKPNSNKFIPTNMKNFKKLRDCGFLKLVWNREEDQKSHQTVKSGDRLVDGLDGEQMIVTVEKGLLTITSLEGGSKYIDNIAVCTNTPTMESIRKVLKNSGFSVMSKHVYLKQ